MLFRRIVLCALLVGVLAGLLTSAVQHWQVIPIIAAAEVLEGSGPAVEEMAAASHAHADGDAPAHGQTEPASDTGRHLWTALANVLTATGFGLVLVAAITSWEHVRGRALASARSGLPWGAAGWLCVFALPALGLPPELPGSGAAPLAVGPVVR
jgi:predicted cobalt transporter CbtA